MSVIKTATYIIVNFVCLYVIFNMSATVIRQNDELYLERGNNNAC